MTDNNLIGKVSATEKEPTTVDEFCFWIQDGLLVKPFDILKVPHYNDSKTYGIIEEIIHITDSPGHIGSYVSSDFGDANSEAQTLRLGLCLAKCKVLSNHSKNGSKEQIYMPVKDGTPVYFANEEEIIEALGLKNIKHPIPAGFIETSNASVPISFSSDFLIGPEGAHLNISGISGLATKTSYAMFLLQALQQNKKDIAIIILNVKSDDLLRLDEENPIIKDNHIEEYKKSGLECKPFQNVTYFYPYQKNCDKKYSNTYLSKGVLLTQHEKNSAFNYIYTYEKDRNKLDLLFSNIDDPQETMESIIIDVCESNEFEGLTWESFINHIRKYTEKGNSQDKKISIASWRKFSRLISKSITTNNIFQENISNETKRQVHLSEKIKNIQKGDAFVIDIAKLDEQLQCFVFGDIVKAVYDLKLGDEVNRNENDIPSKIVVFVDELNKYAASSAPKNSPILKYVREITERGRSIGIILFSAEQFKSAIDDRVKGNCSTHVYGRTNAIEISKPDYRFIPKVFSNMMTRLYKGELIIEHPIFRTLLKIKFPFPSYHQGQE